MKFRKRNWLHETRNQEIDRRLTALEAHITDLDARYSVLENLYNVQAAVIRGAVRGESVIVPDEIEIRADEANLPEPNFYAADGPSYTPQTSSERLRAVGCIFPRCLADGNQVAGEIACTMCPVRDAWDGETHQGNM